MNAVVIAEAQIATGDPGRYLQRLCTRLHGEIADGRGVIRMEGGRCTLTAGPGVLTLTLEAPDDVSLRTFQQTIGRHLEPVRWVRTVQSGSWEEKESTGLPRWVKVAGIVIVLLILLVVVAVVIGIGGGHGPGRHFSVGKGGVSWVTR